MTTDSQALSAYQPQPTPAFSPSNSRLGDVSGFTQTQLLGLTAEERAELLRNFYLAAYEQQFISRCNVVVKTLRQSDVATDEKQTFQWTLNENGLNLIACYFPESGALRIQVNSQPVLDNTTWRREYLWPGAWMKLIEREFAGIEQKRQWEARLREQQAREEFAARLGQG